MKRAFSALAVALVLTACTIDHTIPPRPGLYSRPTTPMHRITEDDPRWDCHTMGNRICGPKN